MSFLGDLKTLTVESAKAIGAGVELLSEFAEEASKASERLLTQTRVARLEKELSALAEGPRYDQERAEKCGQLLTLYDELAALFGSTSDADIAARKNIIFNDLSRQSTRKLLGRIETLEQSVARSHFSLPIQEITQKRDLLTQIDALLVQLERGDRAGLAGSFFAKKNALITDIAQLESLRATEEVSYFSSGVLFSRIEKYDGKRHGCSEYWYEGGCVKLKMKYAHGQISGPIFYWREDKSVLFEGRRLPYSNLELTGYLRNGARVFQGELGPSGYYDLWFAGAAHAGRVRIENGQVRKLGFITRLMFNYSFWRTYLRLYRSEGGPTLMEETLEVIQQFDRFADDLSQLAVGQDPPRTKTVPRNTRTLMGLGS